MPVIQQYYLDAPSLGSATSVFIDSALTVCAPDGYYSDGVITREQVGCVLLPEQPCPECGLPCDSTLLADEDYQGVFRVDSNSGTATGAIKVWLDPQNIPEGIRVVFNSQVYNKLSSPIDGLHQTTSTFGYTYIGNTANDCGITGMTYPALTNYTFDGVDFVNQGSTQTITITAADVSLSAGNPGKCLMVIPKPSPAVAILNAYIVGPCATSAFELQIDCPELLPSVLGTAARETPELACTGERSEEYYFASVNNALTIGLYDYVFLDAYGSTPLGDGYYGIDNGGTTNYIQIQSGIVIAIGVCCAPGGGTYGIVTDTSNAWNNPPADIGNFTSLVWRVRSNNGAWSAPTAGAIAAYNNNFGSNPVVTLDDPTFEACFEVEIGVQYGTNFYFPSNPPDPMTPGGFNPATLSGFPGWIWGNCATQYIAVNCIDRNTPPPLSTSPYMSALFTNPTLQPYNYMILMTPDPTTLYTNTDRYGTVVNAYWRFSVVQKAWIGGPTVISDPLLGPVGPVTQVDLWIYEPI